VKTFVRTILYIMALLWLAIWIIPMVVCHFLFWDRIGDVIGAVACGPLMVVYAVME
jgi:hypothetical protein